jgi:tRNA A-37 threonylcarbamoyl transferase component Bud32
MSEVIMKTLHGKRVQELMYILERFGAFLADFHMRYNGMQHGDLTPANVFYDPHSGRFCLVDVAGLAPRNPVIQSDTDRFTTSLRLLSNFFGPDLFMQGKAQFEAGYGSCRRFMH